MENYIGKICPYCKSEIKEGEPVQVCPACGIPHHVGCWQENKGCTTFGCSQQNYEAQGTNPTAVCAQCGAPLGDTQAFCPKCGAPKMQQPMQPQPMQPQPMQPQPMQCASCGAPMNPGQEFCGVCGQKPGMVYAAPVAPAINQYNAGVAAPKKKSSAKVWIITIAIVLVVALVGGFGYVGISDYIEEQQKEDLHAELMSRTWWTYDEDTKLFLDFSYSSIEYSGNFGVLGEVTIANIDYEVIDGDTIKVYGKEIEVEFREKSVVFTPSFVNTDAWSLWMK